jgi:hypothetical protein
MKLKYLSDVFEQCAILINLQKQHLAGIQKNSKQKLNSFSKRVPGKMPVKINRPAHANQ